MFFQVFSPEIVHTASFGGDRCKAVGPGGFGSNRLCLLQALVSHHCGNPSGAIKLYLHAGVLLVSLRMEFYLLHVQCITFTEFLTAAYEGKQSMW